MNAFVEIAAQLVRSVPPSVWKEQRFFPFPQLQEPRARLFDACVFGQFAWGALGFLWLEFEGAPELLSFPFRLARHSDDGDLYTMSPWSLREASTDPEFFQAWKVAMFAGAPVTTERGALFRMRSCGGQPSLLAMNVHGDERNIYTRVELREALKIFRTCSRENSNALEVDVLTYLNQQNVFQHYPWLISVFEYSSRDFPNIYMAISTKYIENSGTIWHDFLAKLHAARYPTWDRTFHAEEAWADVLKTAETLGRLLGEFHRAMTYARENPTLVPEATTGEQKHAWLAEVERVMRLRIERLANSGLRFPEFASLGHDCSVISRRLLERTERIENLGIRIRIHGRVHLGRILSGPEGYFIYDFGRDEADDEAFAHHKHSSLKDLAALVLSLRYAWQMTDRRDHTPIVEEFVDRQSNFGRVIHVGERTQDTLPIESRVFRTLELRAIRSYLSVINEDPGTAELVPPPGPGFDSLYDLMMILRMLRECRRDFESGNPRCKTSLRILAGYIKEVEKRGAL